VVFLIKVKAVLFWGKQPWSVKGIYLKGYFSSAKMNVYLKWVIYVEEM